MPLDDMQVMTANQDQIGRAADDGLTLKPVDFAGPRIRLAGEVDYGMYNSFRDQLDAAPRDGLVVVELSTLGGDPKSRG
jgi:hypothetical protein